MQSLGFEVFIPKIVPNVSSYRSAVVTHEYDAGLKLPREVLAVLNSHDFYQDKWTLAFTKLLNRHFRVLITSLSDYTAPLFEGLQKFNGLVIARVFGREQPRTYSEFFEGERGSSARRAVTRTRSRFIFCQGFDQLSEVEEPFLKARAQTVTVPVPAAIWRDRQTWSGNKEKCLFLCPNILDSEYYAASYRDFRQHFGDLPYVIFGKQNIQVSDPHVMPYLSDDGLLDLYRGTNVFLYTSVEPRHVHYSPIEAMIVGAPVLYLKGSLLSRLSHVSAAGCCDSLHEMKEKAILLLEKEGLLLNRIQKSQSQIVAQFSMALARRQWVDLLDKNSRDSRSPLRKAASSVVFYLKWDAPLHIPRRFRSTPPLPAEKLPSSSDLLMKDALSLLSTDGEFSPGVISDHFSAAEPNGRWTLGPTSSISFMIDSRRWPNRGVTLEMTGWRYASKGEAVRITFEIDDGSPRKLFFVDTDWTTFIIPIPLKRIGRQVIRCVWRIENPLSPLGHGSLLNRQLGMFVGTLTLKPNCFESARNAVPSEAIQGISSSAVSTRASEIGDQSLTEI